MNIEVLFMLITLSTMPFWFMMIALPSSSITIRCMSTYWPIVMPALMYCGLLLFGGGLGTAITELANPTASGVASLLAEDTGATIGWAHFLAFDLFVGRWIYLEARDAGTSWRLAAPSLLFTLMVGPIGFLIWFALRRIGGTSTPAATATAGPA